MAQLKTVFRALGAAAALVVGFASPAVTAGNGPSLWMQTGAVTSQPIGHYEFCQVFKSECAVRSKQGMAHRVTPHGWSVIRSINTTVNAAITPVTDMDVYGKDEVWAYPKDAGDCEDIALLKRRQLIGKGFDPSSLLMTVVRKPDGEGHAVLTVRTAQGDYILDNLNDSVKVWTDTPYRYLKRQATFNSGRWVTIENGANIMVGAVEN